MAAAVLEDHAPLEITDDNLDGELFDLFDRLMHRIFKVESVQDGTYEFRAVGTMWSHDLPDGLCIRGDRDGATADLFFQVGGTVSIADGIVSYRGPGGREFTMTPVRWVTLGADTQAEILEWLQLFVGRPLHLIRDDNEDQGSRTTEFQLDVAEAVTGTPGAVILRGTCLAPVTGHHEELLLAGTQLRFVRDAVDIDDGVSPLLRLRLIF